MNKIYKIIAYLSISLVLSYIVSIGNGDFFKQFTNNAIPLLTTLLAINITASALIASELNRLKHNYPNANTKETSFELKQTLTLQVIFILFLFVVFIIRDWLDEIEFIYIGYYQIATNACLIGVFLYYFEIIYDLGKGLLRIIDFNANGAK